MAAARCRRPPDNDRAKPALRERLRHRYPWPCDTHDADKSGRNEASAAEGPLRDFIVAIDAGHGGQDPGAIGVGKVQEKRVALAIAKELQRLFDNASGYRGVLIRNGDYYLTLRQRTNVARNQRADLFVSIHADAFSGPDARGASVYTLSAKGATSETARWLAEKENASDLIGGAGDVSLDDKDALLAHVLLDLSMDGESFGQHRSGVGGARRARTTSPGCIGRTSNRPGSSCSSRPTFRRFWSRPAICRIASEARSLAQPAYQRKVAQAIFKGVTAYAQRHAPPGTTLAYRQQKRSPPS